MKREFSKEFYEWWNYLNRIHGRNVRRMPSKQRLLYQRKCQKLWSKVRDFQTNRKKSVIVEK